MTVGETSCKRIILVEHLSVSSAFSNVYTCGSHPVISHCHIVIIIVVYVYDKCVIRNFRK